MKSHFQMMLVVILVYVLQLFLALINPYDYYQLSETTILYYILNIVLLFTFSVIVNKTTNLFKFKKFLPNNGYVLIDTIPSFVNKLNLVVVLSILSFFISLVIKYGLSIQGLRDVFFFSTGDFGFTFGKIAIYLWIYSGIQYLLFFIYGTDFFIFKHKQAIVKLLIAMVSIFILDSSTGGRMSVYYMFSMLLVFILVGAIPKISKKIKRKIKFIFISLLIIFIFITMNRLSESSFDFFHFLYMYMIGPVYMFSEAVKAGDLFNNPNMHLGMSMMSIDWIFTGLSKLFGGSEETLYVISNGILSTGYWLSDKEGMNAHFTSFFYYFLDYGFFGVIINNSIVFLLFLFAKLFKETDPRQYLIVIFTYFYLIISIREDLFNSPWFLFLFIGILLSTRFVRMVKLCQGCKK